MKRIIFISVFAVLTYGCKEAANEVEPMTDFLPEFVETSDTGLLSKRIALTDETVMQADAEGEIITYSKIAEVTPNTINGHALSATGLSRLDNKIYVTYHIKGEVYGGEILTFDISNPSQPQLISSIVDETADFNDVMTGQHKGNIWVAGARDIYASNYENTYGAIATKIGLKSNKVPQSSAAWEVPLLSYSASSITRVDPPRGASNGRIFVTSGSSGGLEVIRGNDVNERFHSRQVDNAKHFDYHDQTGVFLRGIDANSSALDIYALDDSFTFSTYVIPYDVTYLGKNGIDVTEDHAFLAMGDDGLVKVNTASGLIEARYKSNGSGEANSVFVDNGLVYLANGRDGLIILQESDLSFVASYDYEGSCNYVEVQDDLVFVANGSTGGLIILQKSNRSVGS